MGRTSNETTCKLFVKASINPHSCNEQSNRKRFSRVCRHRVHTFTCTGQKVLLLCALTRKQSSTETLHCYHKAWQIDYAQQKTQTNQKWQRCIECLKNLQILAMISPANCCKKEKSSCVATNKQSYSPTCNNIYGHFSTCENGVHELPAGMVHVAFLHLVPVQHDLCLLVLACACISALTPNARSPLCLQQQLLPKIQLPSAQRASTAIMIQFRMLLVKAKEQLVSLQHLCAFEWGWAWNTLVCHYGTFVISSSVPYEPF